MNIVEVSKSQNEEQTDPSNSSSKTSTTYTETKGFLYYIINWWSCLMNKIFGKKIKETIHSEALEDETKVRTKNYTRPPSLINIGLNCYLNSALQGLSACDRFVKETSILLHKYNDVTSQTPLEKLYVFNQLINILNSSSVNSINITRHPIFKNWKKLGEQDSYDLLAHILNQVYKELKQHLEDKEELKVNDLNGWLKISLPLRLIFNYDVYCGCGKTYKTPIQSDLALHIPIPKFEKNLQLDSMMDKYFSKNKINDYVCSKTNCTGEQTFRYAKLNEPLPNTICIHFQRSDWNGYEMEKINNEIKFRSLLHIKSTYKSDIQDYENEDSDEIYQLVSVIVHSGSFSSGHYICYKMQEGQWFKTNDSSITPVQEAEVFRCQPYILFYEKNQ